LGSYLDKFRSTLPTTQGNQLLSRLTQKRDNGEIRTLDEFKDNLKALTANLLAEKIKPTFKLYRALVGVDTSSEQWNYMMQLIENDLATAFTEADNIEEVLEAHRNLIQDVSLKTIRYAIHELEAKISFYEFVYQTRHGFDSSLFNTFKETKDIAMTRTDELANTLYADPRNNSEQVETGEDASVDLVGERLTLGASSSYIVAQSASWLNNSHSHRGEITVSFSNSNINNIIDDTSNTYWIEPLLFSGPKSDGASVEICINFAALQNINFVEIEPAASYAMKLVSIDYFNMNNQRLTALSPDTYLTGPSKVYFSRIHAKAIVLRFQQVNYHEVQFSKSVGTGSNFHQALSGKGLYQIDVPASAADLRNILSSDFLLTDILNVPAVGGPLVRYYQYMFGLDNVRCGYSLYRDRGIFVSKAHQVDQLGLVGVKVIETRPTETTDGDITQTAFSYPTRTSLEDTKYYHGAVEYWLSAYHYTADGYLITTDTLPVLPLDASRIYHEVLVFTHKSSVGEAYNNMGALRFFCSEDATDMQVYRNHMLLPYDSNGWRFVATGENTELTLATANAGAPMKRGIVISGGVDPVDIYTVSYTPKLSNTSVVPQAGDTLFQIIDMSGDQGVKLLSNNLVSFSPTRRGLAVAYTKLYLSVILRRTSAQEHLTPAVEEYMLLSSSKNTVKYVKDYE